MYTYIHTYIHTCTCFSSSTAVAATGFPGDVTRHSLKCGFKSGQVYHRANRRPPRDVVAETEATAARLRASFRAETDGLEQQPRLWGKKSLAPEL